MRGPGLSFHRGNSRGAVLNALLGFRASHWGPQSKDQLGSSAQPRVSSPALLKTRISSAPQTHYNQIIRPKTNVFSQTNVAGRILGEDWPQRAQCGRVLCGSPVPHPPPALSHVSPSSGNCRVPGWHFPNLTPAPLTHSQMKKHYPAYSTVHPPQPSGH